MPSQDTCRRLRHEVGGKIRVTTIEPGAIESDLKYGSGDEASRNSVVDFYKQATLIRSRAPLPMPSSSLPI